jgi:hypothetical protein
MRSPAHSAAKPASSQSAFLKDFPEALPMPEIDIAVFDQPLQIPEIAQAVAVAMPSPPPIPVVDWDSLLRPIDLSAFGGLSIEVPVDQGLTAPPDPMLAAAQAVRSVETKTSKARGSQSPSQRSAAAPPQKTEQTAQPVQAASPSARPARKRKSSK